MACALSPRAPATVLVVSCSSWGAPDGTPWSAEADPDAAWSKASLSCNACRRSTRFWGAEGIGAMA
eukprot:929431-Pelagomonas_calceolata.AAC.1